MRLVKALLPKKTYASAHLARSQLNKNSKRRKENTEILDGTYPKGPIPSHGSLSIFFQFLIMKECLCAPRLGAV